MKLKNRLKLGRSSRHMIARVLSLLCAVLIWLFVMYVAPPTYDETYRDVPVSVEQSDILPNYTGRVDVLINVRVYGTKEALNLYGAEDVRAYVRIADLADAEGVFSAGKTYELTVYFDLPEGLAVKDPYRVSMLLENR